MGGVMDGFFLLFYEVFNNMLLFGDGEFPLGERAERGKRRWVGSCRPSIAFLVVVVVDVSLSLYVYKVISHVALLQRFSRSMLSSTSR